MRIKYLIPTTLLAVAMGSSALGEDVESRVTELENQMQQIRVVTPNETCGATTALARPVLEECNECCGTGVFFELSAIYWHPKVGGTEFAYTDNDKRALFPIKGKTKDIGFDWDWGLKAGVGYNAAHDGWDIFLHYTWFDSHGSDKTSAGRNDSVIPLRGAASLIRSSGNLFGFCERAKSQYDFTFNAIDLELGRNYFISEMLALRPHVGLKTSWIDLEQITRYYGGGVSDMTINGLFQNTVHVKDDNEFWGLGPRVGVNSNWHMGEGFSIFGDASAALLYGRFEVDHRERYSANKDIDRIHLEAERHAFVPTVQFMLGVEYDTYVNCDRNHLKIRLGYESQYFWRANQMAKVNYEVLSGTEYSIRFDRYSEDVSMHGVTLDVRVDF